MGFETEIYPVLEVVGKKQQSVWESWRNGGRAKKNDMHSWFMPSRHLQTLGNATQGELQSFQGGCMI